MQTQEHKTKETMASKKVPVELEGDGERSGGLPRARRAVEQHVRQLQGTRRK
jgi:hypothetical protein